jgi:tetratricopeptide (TPR) repeat protein
VDLRPDVVLHLTKSAEHWATDGQTAALILASNIGWRAKVDGLDGTLLISYFDETRWGRLLLDTAAASHHLELGHGDAALERVDQAIASAINQNLGTGHFWARLQLLKGDIYYLLQDLESAARAYAEGASASSPLSFERAWCSWRSGALREDADACRDAARAFRHLGFLEFWARALGARSALLMKGGHRVEGLRLFEELLEAYFVRREALAGPALAIAQAHMVRLSAEVEGRSVPDAGFPGFGADPYERVLSSAQPRSGPALSYYVLGDAYALLGEVDAGRRAFTRALESLGEDTLSKNILPPLVKRSLDYLSGSEADSALIRKCVRAILQQQASGDAACTQCLGCLPILCARQALRRGAR